MAGKTALVTGGSAGIGYAIAGSLARAGINVVACARNPYSHLEALSKSLPPQSGKVIGKKTDLLKEAEILALFLEIETEFGHVDILVNNAGGSSGTASRNLSEGKTDDWRQLFEVAALDRSKPNSSRPDMSYSLRREMLRLLDKDGVKEGQIININSTCGHNTQGIADKGTSFYSGTKHMLTALTKLLQEELAKKKSKICITSPGMVKTRAVEAAIKRRGFEWFDFTPLECSDIADAVLYVLGTPDRVVIRELTITSNGQIL